jgi:light-regulated signal transduction histidine kinase (bacteriophytochrome)
VNKSDALRRGGQAQDQPNVDLTNCDREPIHQLGTIQPMGFLIAVTKDWLVARVSANVASFIGREPNDLLGSPLAEFLLPTAMHDLRNRVVMLRGADAVERLFSCELVKDGHFDVAVHMSGSFIVVEAEPGEGHAGDMTGTVKSMMGRLDQMPDLRKRYCDTFVHRRGGRYERLWWPAPL